MQRYHVRVGQRETTVSFDNIVSELLSLRLGVAPGTSESRNTVRKWLQAELDRNDNPDQKGVSQWLHRQAVKAIAGDLLHRYNRWRQKSARARVRARIGRARSRIGHRFKRRAGSAGDTTQNQPV
jgi:hypothetical protein